MDFIQKISAHTPMILSGFKCKPFTILIQFKRLYFDKNSKKVKLIIILSESGRVSQKIQFMIILIIMNWIMQFYCQTILLSMHDNTSKSFTHVSLES